MFERCALGRPKALLAVLIFAVVTAGPLLAADPNGLVAHWPFSETSGTVTADQGPNALDGTLLNGAHFADGILGNGVQLDGEDDYVNITDAGGGFPTVLGGLGQGTISMWFKFDRLTTTGEIFPIFYLGDGVGGSGQSSVIVEIGHFNAGNSELYFTVFGDDTQPVPIQCFNTITGLDTDRWYHFAAVVGPAGNTGYLNGEELTDRHYYFADASATYFLDDVVDQQAVWIGRGFLGYNPLDQFFDGDIDEVLVYDRALSASEIEEYYQSIVPEPASALYGLLGARALFGLFRRRRKRSRQ